MDKYDEIDAIVEPVPLQQAFEDITPAGEFSRAAFLLSLGALLNQDYAEIGQELVETAPFELPTLSNDQGRFDTDETLAMLQSDGIDFVSLSGQAEEIDRIAAKLIHDLYANSLNTRLLSAIHLLAIFLNHPNQLLSVCANVSWAEIANNIDQSIANLGAAGLSESMLVREMAMTAIVRILYGPAIPLFMVLAPPAAPAQHTISNASFIVHGTLFGWFGHKIDDWWSPGSGDFHDYLLNGPRPNVYNSANHFLWSGGWTDQARILGARDLIAWIDRYQGQGADVFAHSHGCNVTMLTSEHRKLGSLVLMSCPVHWSFYQPTFANVADVISVRVKWDFTIMCDRGGQRFNHPQITENVLPIWFDHSASRRPGSWINHNLDQLL